MLYQLTFSLKETMKDSKPKLQTIQVTLQERMAATRPNVYKNRKKYTRKEKHPHKNLDT